jgi:hypothetical protein
LYAEQFYKLYHQHLTQAPEDSLECIFYLEQALKSDFCNPLYALAKIDNKDEWKKYRYLFKMHVNLLLVKTYLVMGSKFDKQEVFFFNYPWKSANLKSLEKAEEIYRTALLYWNEARKWSAMAAPLKTRLEEINYWHDENFRVESGDLDYRDIVSKQLARLERVRSYFKTMGPGTY